MPKQAFRTITINPALNGYIVSVGCTTVVFNSRDKLLTELSAYLVDPPAIEESYLKNSLHTGSIQGPCNPTPIGGDCYAAQEQRERSDQPPTLASNAGAALR